MSANTNLVHSLISVIRSLSLEERQLLEEKLFFDNGEPSTAELLRLAERGGGYDFLHSEPDLYTLDDGKPV
ncbi:hypothetical protein ISF26_17570 [Gloeobacter morelensis MG652769]|uniref:Nif11 domain-containing protein n=2 Tax=Gloeobacter TaxID=33071 RepID=A0ABY3PTG7_9CYAN|nr:hypothetical protein ISF26_17570 [Gloeobacter morelensis MG652769]